MSSHVKREIPEPVRKIIEAIVGRAVARCHSQGIALKDFVDVVLKELELHPKASVEEVYERAFRRLEGRAN
jgi:hypothetical protein